MFLTLDDGTGPVDATFFEDAQGPYASTVFSSWLLLVRGELRRTGRRGVSLRATGAWELPALHALWQRGRTDEEGLELVRAELATVPEPRRRRARAAPGARPHQRVPDVALLRHQAGRRPGQGRRPQAVAPQSGESGMSQRSGSAH